MTTSVAAPVLGVCAATSTFSSTTGVGSGVVGAAAGAALGSPMRTMTAPTSTVSSSSCRISTMVPATGEGTSVSTLSVETSRRASSTSTVSPTCLSQRVMVPSVTDSPSSGMTTSVAAPVLDELALEALAATDAEASTLAATSTFCSAAGAAGVEASLASPISAMTAPTSTVSSSSCRTLSRTPAAGEGISVSTLSVETSSSGSSTSTVSPTCFSQRVIVPSVTDSPSSGISTENAIVFRLLD